MRNIKLRIWNGSVKEQGIGDEIRNALYPIVLSFSNIKSDIELL